ncbi:uncharacterized protein A1O9_02304 [Exophiala aquamarina CBS 119918]|uniref:Transcription factor domain-containing protein n=1 Tax=Exophiala aquamarina CBS 119918 TaxID=1182545 RepID=A0A072PN37_9EURO|nr:uncharacterized protein A1O9_02304 [Exophiala aquamarina CBS 119918]KEF60743.1 hypothetical protein A1O9_02304 [Exophiala aquamarina CBS 119918]
MFSQSTEPIRLLMVHLSWHQAYCDLYRIFLPGYREAAPFSILQKLDEQKSMEWQGLCLQHAVAIVHLLSEFSAQCSPPAVDFDIAVCAYHSSRLVLFIAANTFTQRLSRTDALQLARFSQSILSRYFVGYPMADPMMKEIDDTITRCSCEWTGTGTLELQDIEASNEDYEATQGRIRRQLAIHSLIRQANFEGDCHDGTRSEIRRSNVEFQLSTMPQNQSTLTALPAREIATPFGMARVEDSQGAGEIATVEEQSGHIQSESGSEKRTMPNVSTPHENHNREEWRNDMQAVFNPWMGFSESLESYGLALSLEDDYF